MDGTLVDTEPYWMKSETELVTSYGGSWTHEDALTLVGAGLWNSAKALQSHGVTLSGDEIVDWLTNRVQEQLDADGVPWRPGAKELLADLREHDVPTALVTMSVRRMAEQIVSKIPFDAFDVVVAGDMVARPKPFADPYLLAAEMLGVDAKDSVAIEDSRAGLASAVAAGTIAIGVPHILELDEGSTHTIWPTLAERGYDDIVRLAEDVVSARTPQA
jgi:HAD superfamily hydrolase (TIGR01509 family)